MGSLRIALAQLNLTVGDIQGNAERILAAAEEARDRLRADLVVFPELSLTGYPPEDLVLRPGLWQRVQSALAEIAERVRGVELVVGYPRQHEGRLYNACSVIGTGCIKVTYHKQHLPNYSVFDEKRYFVPGAGAQVVEIKGIALALSICEDIWIAGTASQARDAGAQAIVNINASPFHLGKAEEREEVLKRACQEGGLPIIYVNLVGGQDELVFDGGSTVLDANGAVCFRAPDFTESIFPVDLDLGRLVSPRAGEVVPASRAEPGIYQALVLGVRDYARKNGFRGAVLGVSGGIDSALTLAIAVDA
ncbi:MAG: nitrilase-related carbon-nitrogen hydrolase, partial [Gammaproteobacteria bacterium]